MRLFCRIRLALAAAGEIYGQMSQVSNVLEQPADEVIGKVRLLIISRIFSERFDDFLADWSSPASVSAVCPSTWWRRTSTPDCSGACLPTKGLPMSLWNREQKMSPDGSDVRIARRLARCRVLRLQVPVLIE
jgi:hypothetical protein